MSQIVILGQLDIHPDDAEAVAELMRVMMTETMKEKGCHHYAFARDLTMPARFQLSELWEDGDCLAAHFQAGHMAVYRAAMAEQRVLQRTVTRFDVTNVKSL